MASGNDPFDFNNDDYVESQVPDFNNSFMEQFRAGSSDEEEFLGFTREEIYLSSSSRVRSFQTDQRSADKENIAPERRLVKKKKADPSK